MKTMKWISTILIVTTTILTTLLYPLTLSLSSYADSSASDRGSVGKVISHPIYKSRVCLQRAFTATISPNVSDSGQTQEYTITFTADPANNKEIGSVSANIPPGFTDVTISSVTAPYSFSGWTGDINYGQIRLESFNNEHNVGKLAAGQFVSVTFSATAPTSAGTYEWTAKAYEGRGWGGDIYNLIGKQPIVTVSLAPTPPPCTWSSMDSGTTWGLDAIWGHSQNDIFAAGDAGTMLYYNGNAWTAMNGVPAKDYTDIWGTDINDIFAVGGGGTIIHYNGISWSEMNSGLPDDVYNTIYGVWGNSSTDVFAVAGSMPGVSYAHGKILHYDGSSWSPMNIPVENKLHGVWGFSSSDVFAVGTEGTILHYDGNIWSQMDSGTTAWLNEVWGMSSGEVYAVGDMGTILHYDGTTWSQMNSGTTENLFGVWGFSSSDIFASGRSGTILHYDGTSWSPMNSGTGHYVYDIWGGSVNDVFAVGSGGTIIHYLCDQTESTPTPTPTPTPTSRPLPLTQGMKSHWHAPAIPTPTLTFPWEVRR